MQSEEGLTTSGGLRKRRWEGSWEGAWAQLSGCEDASPSLGWDRGVVGLTLVGPESAEVGSGFEEGNVGAGAPRKQLGPEA